MFQMRLKLGTAGNKEWRCCFCLHVRTATILLGVWHLVLHVVALTVLAIIMRDHQVIVQKHDDLQQTNFLPTPLSKEEVKDSGNPYYLPTTQDGRTIYTSDMDMGALMTVCTLAITLLLVYGTIKGKATYLFPFFCLQLFDFAIAMLTATGYFCYLRSVHRLIEEHWHNLPFRKELLQMSPQYLSLLVLGAFMISMLWKAYCIGIVWRCYKYLTLRQQTMRNTIHYILPAEGSDRLPDPDYSTLIRDHEAAFGSMKQTPPPSYQDIMDDQPPPYPAYLAQTAAGATAVTPTTFAVVNDHVPQTPTIPLQDEAAAVIVENIPASMEGRETPQDAAEKDESSPSKEGKYKPKDEVVDTISTVNEQRTN